jgi:hypothetical protein
VRKRSLPMSTLAKEEGAGEWVEVSQFFSRKDPQKNQLPTLGSITKPTAVTTPEAANKTDTEKNLSAESQAAKIKDVELHPVVSIHFVLGGLLCVLGFFALIIALGSQSSAETRGGALQLVVILFSGGIGLFIAGIILAWLHECVARLRNIELNTAKAVEKLAK